MANTFGPKDVRATLLYQFDFTNVLGIAEYITSAVVTALYTSGPVVPSPSDLTAMVSGDATWVEGLVSQLITGGYACDTYELLCTINTSNDQVIPLSGSVYVNYF